MIDKGAYPPVDALRQFSPWHSKGRLTLKVHGTATRIGTDAQLHPVSWMESAPSTPLPSTTSFPMGGLAIYHLILEESVPVF